MARPRTYRIVTLGCRVNHAETRDIEAVLAERGLERAGAGYADLEVVHTCSVTMSAAAKSRQAVRRARRRTDRGTDLADDATESTPMHPPSRVLVTGCYAETNREEAAALVGSSAQVIAHESDPARPDSPNRTMIERLADAVDRWLESGDRDDGTPGREPPRPSGATKRFGPAAALPTSKTLIPLPVVEPRADTGRHVRAELRIQDGCDAHCTFCIIPSIRRTLRSKTVNDAVREARRLVDLGHREVVLSGIFIGAYGHETALRRKQHNPNAEPLADLLDAVAQVTGLDRLRISSMEPGDVTPALLDAMVANAPVVVPHLHLPLQSGSDRVLRMMNRQYQVGAYLDMIDATNEALTTDGLPPALTTDIICGFPGETDADFEQTMAVAQRVGYLHMHVFPYSPRPGTAAARWTSRYVDERTKKARVRALIDLEDEPEHGLSIRYRRRLLDRDVRVILEQPARTEAGVMNGMMTGRCDHYALVHVPTNRARGQLVTVRVHSVSSTRTTGAARGATVRLPVVASA